MAAEDHRRYLDAYLQGAHLALFAIEGTLREAAVLDDDELDDLLARLHDMFSSARRALKEGRPPDVEGLIPFPMGKN